MSDRIAVFSSGEPIGTPGDVYERPANEFVADLVGTSNLIERHGRRFTARPEKIRTLGVDGPAPGDLVETATGVVCEVVYLGPVTRYIVDLDEGRTLVALRQNLETSAGQALAERGRRVRLMWDRDHAFAVQAADGDATPRGGEDRSHARNTHVPVVLAQRLTRDTGVLRDSGTAPPAAVGAAGVAP